MNLDLFTFKIKMILYDVRNLDMVCSVPTIFLKYSRSNTRVIHLNKDRHSICYVVTHLLSSSVINGQNDAELTSRGITLTRP